MKKGRTMIPLLAGILVGALLVGPVAGAVEDFLKATPSAQKFYVDGQQVEMEAYAIEGYNYVKLRDIGRMVGFDVSYDAATDSALITTGMAYVDDEASAPVPAPQPIEAADYAAQANPAIFKGELTREAYNGIRSVLVTGASQTAVIAPATTDREKLVSVASRLGRYPSFEILTTKEVTSFVAKYPEAYVPAANHTQSFVDGISELSEREQVEQIIWYVCDRLSYSAQPATLGKVLSSDGVTYGSCMSYAHTFQFLCQQAEIPCVVMVSENHQWNRVYVEGAWWDTDLTGADAGDDTATRKYATLLYRPEEMWGEDYWDIMPDVTLFVEELLVPGSTK